MRATRAYVAGFGTSGSLLAGAAVLFLLGSAIVALNGWPQIAAGGPATSNVTGAPVAVASRAARRLTVALASTHPHALTRRGKAGARVRGAARTRRVGTGHPGVGETPVSTGAPSTGSASTGSAGASSGAPGVTGPSTCSGCHNPGSSLDQITTLTNTIAQTVSTVGNDGGQQITGLSGTVSGQVSGVSPPTGSAVGTVGSSAGNTVTGTASTAANTITTIGSGH